ncbi:MAG: hypothetical protein LBR34_05270 [Prevotella sp.]|nr:hypothetical protein [Prevotella sp.]
MKTIKFIILLVGLPLTACSGQGKDSLALPQEPAFKIRRFDRELHDYLQEPAKHQKALEVHYSGFFLPAFGRVTINSSDVGKPEFFERLQKYFSNDMLSQIYLDELKTFEDVSLYERQLSQAAAVAASELPGSQLPAMCLHVSGFKENVIVGDNLISVSADKYLGKDYPVYRQFFEPYRLIQMQSNLITRDYLKAWLLSDLLPPLKTPKLLDDMVREGKVLFALSRLLPDCPLPDLLGYTPEQETWCNSNEKQIWRTIVKSNHLYSSDYLLIGRYVNEAPYTATLGAQSPGRVGAWVGWRIVQAYASKNNVLLAQLFSEDAQKILKASDYNP